MVELVEIPVTKKDRLDRLLVELKLAPTRANARALILAGRVKVDSQVVDKAGALITPGRKIEVAEGTRFASHRRSILIAVRLPPMSSIMGQ